MFTSYSGDQNRPVEHFKFVIGVPNCGSKQMWPVLHYAGVSNSTWNLFMNLYHLIKYTSQSYDKLVLLDDGKLRHYTNTEEDIDEQQGVKSDYDEDTMEEHKPHYYDYEQGQYCLDKASNLYLTIIIFIKSVQIYYLFSPFPPNTKIVFSRTFA